MARSHADKIRQLSKQWFKTGDDRILDEIQDSAHENIYRDVEGRLEHATFKNYLSGTARFHWHARIDACGDLKRRFVCCASLERRVGVDCAGSMTNWDGNSCISTVGAGDRDSPVLIAIRELVQDRQGVSVWREVPSVVRLQALDECQCAHGDGFPDSRLQEVITLHADRVPNPVAFMGRLLDPGQRADEVVQGRSTVMNTVADKGAQSEWWRSCDIECDTPIARVLVNVQAESWIATVDVRPGFCVEDTQMFFCSKKFSPDTVKRSEHG